MPPSRVRPPPSPTPEQLADNESLGRLLDQLLQADPGLRRHSREIRRRQAALRARVDDDTWAAYLAVEEATTARSAEVAIVVAEWAGGHRR